MKRVFALLGGALVITRFLAAQGLVPVEIQHGGNTAINEVNVFWPTIPGRTYDVRTRDGLDAPWVITNAGPWKAKTTRAFLNMVLGGEEAPVRFFQILEQAVPPGNNGTITSNTVVELEKVLGLTFTPAQRTQLLSTLASSRTSFEAMRKIRLLNSDSLPLVFDATPDGFSITNVQQAVVWSEPQHSAVPTNKADLAFYSARDLGELIRTRKITSTELTQLYLDRLKRYDPTLHCVITLTEDLALKQAAVQTRKLPPENIVALSTDCPTGSKTSFPCEVIRPLGEPRPSAIK